MAGAIQQVAAGRPIRDRTRSPRLQRGSGRCLWLPLAVGLVCVVAVTAVRAAATPAEEIAHLLSFVATSSCSFMRNGRSYPSTEARAHLEQKYAYVKNRIKTAEDFIEFVASRSSTSGKPYLVRCGRGDEQASSEWFRAELERIRSQPR
jgi:Family of unknown function (DUF5329)